MVLLSISSRVKNEDTTYCGFRIKKDIAQRTKKHKDTAHHFFRFKPPPTKGMREAFEIKKESQTSPLTLTKTSFADSENHNALKPLGLSFPNFRQPLDATPVQALLILLMTTKFIQGLILTTLLSLSSCRYSDEFTGTYNQKAATLGAFSKNIEKDCITLTLKSELETRVSAIDADSVFDWNDPLHGKAFNTKNEKCSSKLAEYLVGTRSTKIINTSLNGREVPVGGNLCQIIYYPHYLYQDTIQFEFRNTLSDQTTGAFSGSGHINGYTDWRRPSGYGPIFPCNGGFPRPFPGGPVFGPLPPFAQ